MGSWKRVGENLVRHWGGTIYLRAKVAGKPIRQSLETSDLRVAKLKRDEKLENMRQKAITATSEVTTVGDALELVAKRTMSKNDLKAKTLRYYTQMFVTLRSTLPLKLAGSAWTAELAAAWWKDYSAKRSAQQANNGLQAVRKMGAMLVESGGARTNPAAKIKNRRIIRTKVTDMPSVDDMNRIVASTRERKLRCSKEAAQMIEFLAWSGLRIAELQTLRWEDVSDTWLTVTGGKIGTKNMEERRVPINSRLQAILARRRQPEAAGPLFSMASPRESLSGACERLGLRHMRVHDLRHWFASHSDFPTLGIPIKTYRDFAENPPPSTVSMNGNPDLNVL